MKAWTRGTMILCALALAACGGSTAPAASTETSQTTTARGAAPGDAAAAQVPSGDWTRFGYDAQRSGVGPASTGIGARDLRRLKLRRVHLDGTVDSSSIELHAIRIRGRLRDIAVVTTTYGRTIAFDVGTGGKLWEFVPPDIGNYEGSDQITNTSPIADPDRRYVFAASPDGVIRKLVLTTGREVRSAHWPARTTLLSSREKLATALNISGNSVLATTGGYIGDAPPYQGHVATIDRASGQVTHVWNSLCSGRHYLINPSSCRASDSAIWSRAGAVVEPGSGRILVATGNGPFNGSTNWGDSAIELSPDASRVLHSWTPGNQGELNSSDTDLGSTSPALLPKTGGLRLAVQGGKEGNLSLINLDRGPAGRTGGELQRVDAPGRSELFTQPVVWNDHGRTYVFVATESGLRAYVLSGGSRPRLSVVARSGSGGTTPVLAGGLLYLYSPGVPALRVFEPTHLRQLASLPLSHTGHWNSPIVVGGRIIIPEGNANDHARSGTIEIYHVPGR